MTWRRHQSKKVRITESGSLGQGLFWCAVILAGFVGLLFLAYQLKPPKRPTEYEGKIVDKWAGYNHSELGSSPYFRLLVENAGGQKSTVAVDRDIYNRAKVGMWIRKTTKGIELGSLTASAPILFRRAAMEGHNQVLTSGGETVYESRLSILKLA